MKKTVSILLAAALLLGSLAGCGGGGGKSDAVTLWPESTGIKLENGVSVELGGYVLDGEEELTVTKQPVEENKDEGYKIEAYDFKLGDMSELSDFIILRIPYDASYCEDGQDPAKCVGAKYKNETTGEWEDVLFEVDTATNELVIYTDHLSTYGAFCVRNEGKRSAYITDIYSDVTGIDQQQAMKTLREYVAGGGAAGKEAVGLAAQIITAHNGFMGGIAGEVGDIGFGTDLTGTILNMASLGNPTFDSALATSAYEKMNKLGKVAAAVKIGAVILSTEKTDADVLGLYKDTAMLAISYAESAAWGLAASGLFIFDYTISSMFEQGMAMKLDKIDEVYVYFNDQFSGTLDGGNDWNARSLKGWRQVLIDIAEANPNEADAKAAIESEIDRYARVFWTLGDMEKAAVVTAIEDKSNKGSVTIPDPTQAEIETLVSAYKAQLYERLYPVTQSVSVYMQRKAEAAYLAAMNEVKAFFNQTITFNIVEDVPDGEKSQYDGYALRFAPLSENAVKESWSGTMKGAGGASTKFTLLGYVQAGCPKELQLFKPSDDPESDEPELTVGFKLSAPVTEVTIGGGLPLEELLGTYLVTFASEDGDESYHYTFVGWADEKVNDTTTRPTIYATGSAYTIKAAATKLYALFTYTTTETGDNETYTLVKGGIPLAAGDKIVVANKNLDISKQYKDEPNPDQPRNAYYALGTQAGKDPNFFRNAVKVTKDGDTIAVAPGVEEITLENGTTNGTFALKMSTGKYLFAVGTANYMGEETDKSAKSSWSITVKEDGNAEIKASAGDANLLRYNPGTDPNKTDGTTNMLSRFSAYKSTSGTAIASSDINIYKQVTGSGGTVEVTHYLTLAEGGDVPPPDPDPVATPTASPKSGEVAKDTSLTLSCATAGAEIYYTLDGSAPTKNSTKYTAPIKITGEMTVKFIAVKSGMADSPVVKESYTIESEGENPGPGPNPGTPSGGKAANPVVKVEDVKVDDGSAEIKLPSADAKLDDAANQKVVSANATKSVAITGGGLNVIIPVGTLTAGMDVNALLVDPKASGSVIKVTKPDGTTAILPIATISGGQAAYVANIPGKYEVIDNSKTFPDANNHWALPAIGFVSARELFKGDSTGAFSPDQLMTRGMLATVLARIDGGKTGGGVSFSDVPTSAWYAKEISWAAQNKLVEGDGKNFNPEEDLTREQLCVILARYLDYSGLYLPETTTMDSFSDMGAVSPWAKSAVEQAVKAGLIDGKSSGALDPQGKATRAEIATILQRFVEGVLK